MERQPKPSNIAGELMTQRLPDEETERSLSAQIHAIRPVTKNNRTYHVLEFVPLAGGNARSINVFNLRQLDDLQPGMTVDITLVRNNKFWNLGTLKKSDQQVNTPPSPPPNENRPSENPTKATFAPTYHPRSYDVREYRIMSMNALNNAVNFVTSFKELLSPTNSDEAFALVDYYRSLMIEMHDPNYGSNRTGESK